MTAAYLLIAALLVVLNGYFVALEFALVGSRKAKLEAMVADGNRRARAALDASSDLPMQLAGAQLGVTMASLGIGFFGESVMSNLIESGLGSLTPLPETVEKTIALIVGLGIVVFFHMLFGEMVPKNISLAGPERALLPLSIPYRPYLALFRPVVRALNAMANAGVRALGVEPRSELTSAHTAEELVVMLAESHEEGLIEEFAHDLMAGVLDFGGRDVSSVMVPRDEIVAVQRTATVREVERAVVATGHSRLPVLDHDLDTVVGFVHSKDLLALDVAAQDEQLPLRLVRRMLVVPRDRTLEELLLSMRKARVHFALVVEPNRATAGVVTLEDLLEELVGDILDESDRASGPLPSRGPADDGDDGAEGDAASTREDAS